MPAKRKQSAIPIECHPLTPDRWDDLLELFGERGACGGCWCMYWKLTRSKFDAQRGPKNKAAFKRVVAAGDPPGLLAYADDRPVGWIALEPRENYPGLARSRILQPVDDKPVWSVTCLFIAKEHRRGGVSVAMLEAAADFARSRGAAIVEGYPVEPKDKRAPDPWVWTGIASGFRRAGFKEVARRSPTRPIMRRVLTGKKKTKP